MALKYRKVYDAISPAPGSAPSLGKLPALRFSLPRWPSPAQLFENFRLVGWILGSQFSRDIGQPRTTLVAHVFLNIGSTLPAAGAGRRPEKGTNRFLWWNPTESHMIGTLIRLSFPLLAN